MDKLIQTVVSVVIAIAASGLLFIGVNKLFDYAPSRWRAFTTFLGSLFGVAVGLVVWGNRISISGGSVGDDNIGGVVVGDEVAFVIREADNVPAPWLEVVIPAILIGAFAGYLLGRVEEFWARLGIGTAAGGVLGLLVALTVRVDGIQFQGLRDTFVVPPPLPNLQIGEAVLWTVIGAAVGAGFWFVRGRGKGKTPWWYVVALGAVGWLTGAFGVADVGLGDKGDAQLGLVVAGLLIGAAAGLTKVPSSQERDRISDASRVYIFLAPALVFIGATLVLPTLRTIYLSFLDKGGDEFVGLNNYGDIFTDETIIDIGDWANIFTSRLFIIGAIAILGGLAIASVMGRATGRRLEASPSSMAPVWIGVFLIATAVFASLRGTIINNLWWVFTVTILASSLGLAIAVLADRSKRESLAKSLIFMPMAISFVGAGIIWQFMFIARPPTRQQTGVLNSIWVGLGQLSNAGTARTVVIILSLAAAAGLLYVAYRGYKAKAGGVAIGSIVTAAPFLWFAYALFVGVGGFVEGPDGEIMSQTIIFTNESPFNNFWLMVVLIWIQTGFTMVIFSAAIKAVPNELLEAAKVDGATESQTFWRVVIPQIATTIGVVVTTLIVLVMKVFDIVKVMTNGNFDTQVIANEMWQRAFTELNFGLGSALAILLFVAVLPIMYLNIRRMQKAAG